MKPALLIIDMQKEYYKGFAKESMDRAAKNINAAADLFREKKLPLVWIQNDKEGGGFNEPDGHEIIGVLKHDKSETNIFKRYKNSFNKTGLPDFVREHSIDTVIVTGFSAAHCVLSTYRAAEDHDLLPVILKGAVAAGDSIENIRFVENLGELISLGFLRKVLSC